MRLLDVTSLSVNYGNTAAVREVSLHVGASEAVALLGPNGAGKTSTLRAISGLVDWSGNIQFSGSDLGGLPPLSISRAGLIQVPEGRRIFGDLSVKENLEVGRDARGPRQEAFSIADVVDLFPPIGGLMRRRGSSLSGGEQQMLAIGRALLAGPRMVLLDEPALGLSPLIAENVFEALRDIKKTIPMLLVEQNSALALRVADRAYVLREGRVVLEGEADQLISSEKLTALYIGGGVAGS